ncbi:MAG: ATP-binding protein, partial [Burkholderiales bacterium]
ATALHDRPRLLELRANPPRPVIVAPPPAAEPGVDRQPESPLTSATDGIRETAIPDATRAIRPVTAEAREEIELIIRGLSRAESRIWVIDQQRRLLALTGSLKRDPKKPEDAAQESPSLWERIESLVLRPIYTRLLSPPSENFEDAIPETWLSTGRQVDHALTGIPASRWRNTTDDRIVIIAAAHPIWSGEEVIGAVVVEETTLPVLTVRHQAFERLLTMTLAVLLLGAGSLFWFASRLSRRLVALRNQAENAIDSQGRIRNRFDAASARDEIGDLSRSFGTMLDRLGQYNAYLERMADRLSHELRTPVAVVGSSLENLKAQALSPEATTYVGRAEEGLRRLNRILTQMREATRLEQMLREVERERFDLCKVVSGCVGGYSGAYPQHRFALDVPGAPLWLVGAPDLIAQLLDKIVDNATDFSPAGEPIEVAVSQIADGSARLSVANAGPLLPATMQGQLFDSMISVRTSGERGTGGPHLGLGLFMVRLIAEFHGADASARNRPDGKGVIVEVRFPRNEVVEAIHA